VKPLELDTALTRAGLNVMTETGVMFNPLAGQWLLTSDTDVNYMVAAKKR
jgi:2-polyprenyl-6-hydroxyphenyl methylase/3-demethylubiquinone-9 3-methyltransferase